MSLICFPAKKFVYVLLGLPWFNVGLFRPNGQNPTFSLRSPPETKGETGATFRSAPVWAANSVSGCLRCCQAEEESPGCQLTNKLQPLKRQLNRIPELN